MMIGKKWNYSDFWTAINGRFQLEVEWGQICQDPLTFCGRRPASGGRWAGGLSVDLDENRADLSKARDGIDVAEESAGKRFKVEWDFHEEKIKKFVNLGERNLHLKRIETGN